MKLKSSLRKAVELGIVFSYLILVGCGGGGGASTATPTTSTLSGTAATGAPIVGGTVVAIDSSTPAKTFTATATTSSLGAYTVNVTGGTAPFLLTVTGSVAGQPVTLSSVATALTQTVNITPLTDLIVSTAAGTPGGASLVSLCTPPVQQGCSAALAAATTSTNLSSAVTAVMNMIAPLNTTNINPLTTAFVANGTGMDAVLDQILVTPASAQGATATVTLFAVPTQQLGTVTMPATAGSAAIPTSVPLSTSNAGLIVGTWSKPTQAGVLVPYGDGIVFTFFANGYYTMSQAATPPLDTSVWPGMERGTYTWNPNTGDFTTGGCPTSVPGGFDNNGQAGLSHDSAGICSAATRIITVSGNTVTVRSTRWGSNVVFTRVPGITNYLADVTSAQGVTELIHSTSGPSLVAYNRKWVDAGAGSYNQSATVVREWNGTNWSATPLSTLTETHPTYYMNANTTAWTVNDGAFAWTLNADNTLTTTHPRVGLLTMTINGTDLSGTPILNAAGASIGTYPAGSTAYTQTGAVSSLANFRIFVDPFYAVTDVNGTQLPVAPTLASTFCTQGVSFKPLVPATGGNFEAFATSTGLCDAVGIAAATTLGPVTLGQMPGLNVGAPAVFGVTSTGVAKNAIIAAVLGVTGVYSGSYQTAGKSLGLIFDKNRIATDAEIIANGGVALP